MITAKDLMHKSTPSVSFDSTVAEAIDALKKSPSGFVAVKASEDRLQGVITEGLMMRIYLRHQAQPTKQTLILYRDLFEPMQLIQSDEVFPDVVKKLVTAVGHRVFVIDSKGALMGYISAKDILPFFSGLQSQASEKDSASSEELRSDLYLYENFFSKSPFMMHSVDPAGVIQMANETLHAMLGYEYGELIGKTIFDLYPAESHQNAKAGLQVILDDGYHNVVSSKMVRKNGDLFDVELVSRVLTNQIGRRIGTITVSRPLDMRHLMTAFANL